MSSCLVVKSFGQPVQEEELSPAVQVLLGKLFSLSDRDRINAALKLADYNHISVVSNLISVIKNDNNEMVRRVALRSLGYIGDYKAVEVLLESMSSDKIGIKIEAMSSSVNFSTRPITNVLIAKTQDINPIVRQSAVACLGKLSHNNDDIVNAIVKSLKDISEGVRVAACKVVGNKRIIKAVPFLHDILENDRSEVVREYAVQALGGIRGDRVEEILKNTLDDSSPIVRINAAKSLAMFGSKAGLGEAIQGMKSPDSRIRVIACNILGLVGDEETVMFLQQAIQDYDRRVQRAAQEALRKYNKRKEKNVY